MGAWETVRVPLASALAGSLLTAWIGASLFENKVKELYDRESQRLEVRLIAAPNAGPNGRFEAYPRSVLENKRGFTYRQSDLEQVTNLSVDPPQGYRGTVYEFAIDAYMVEAAERLMIQHYKDKAMPSSTVTLWDTNQDCRPDSFRFVDDDNNTEAEITRSTDGTLRYKGIDEQAARELVAQGERSYCSFRSDPHLQEKLKAYTPKLEIRF